MALISYTSLPAKSSLSRFFFTCSTEKFPRHLTTRRYETYHQGRFGGCVAIRCYLHHQSVSLPFSSFLSFVSLADTLRVDRIKSFAPTPSHPFVLGLPTGSSPIAIYNALVQKYKAGEISFENVVTFNMVRFTDLLARPHPSLVPQPCFYTTFVRSRLTRTYL